MTPFSLPPSHPERVRIFDTTLRDGEQAPGFSMDTREKLELARALVRLQVDAIEAGFPASSPEDWRSVAAIAREVGAQPDSPSLAALARALPHDVEAAASSLQAATKPRIHVFLATSDLHLRSKLNMSRAKALEVARIAVRHARERVEDVEFSAEDGSRSDPVFLAEIAAAVLEEGAGIFNLPDTVGYATPGPFGQLVADLLAQVPAFEQAILSVHCHDDLGLAVANSLEAVRAGARQVECTLNGIGERAGNAALEEIVMALATRRDQFQATTGVESAELYPASRLLSHLTGIAVPPNKAVVGANAFAHESGIHQHGVLMERETYEIMRPQDVGRQENELVLGKHSGKHALFARLEALGFEVDDPQREELFESFKRLAEVKKRVFDDDLVALVADRVRHDEEGLALEYLHVVSGSGVLPTASVRLRKGGQEVASCAHGDGPVEAALQAIDRALGIEGSLTFYSLRAATPGMDALGEVSLGARVGTNEAVGKGTATDVVEASARAYVDALTRLGVLLPDGSKASSSAPQETASRPVSA